MFHTKQAHNIIQCTILKTMLKPLAERLVDRYLNEYKSISLLFGCVSLCSFMSWTLFYHVIAAMHFLRKHPNYTSRINEVHVQWNSFLFSFFLTLILNAVYWAPSIQHQVAFTLPENHNFYYSIIELHIYISNMVIYF